MTHTCFGTVALLVFATTASAGDSYLSHGSTGPTMRLYAPADRLYQAVPPVTYRPGLLPNYGAVRYYGAYSQFYPSYPAYPAYPAYSPYPAYPAYPSYPAYPVYGYRAYGGSPYDAYIHGGNSGGGYRNGYRDGYQDGRRDRSDTSGDGDRHRHGDC